ncbi:unnamed protein product [Closterium sp. Yama58-4]|nr:unnamed protein product [Closterium sp. Yama58-4]
MELGSTLPVSALDAQQLRLFFAESLARSSRAGAGEEVEARMAEMRRLGLRAGARAHHAAVVVHTAKGDLFEARRALRRMLNSGVFPLYETLVAVLRLSGRRGQVAEGEGILALMGGLKLNQRAAWVVLIVESPLLSSHPFLHHAFPEELFASGSHAEGKALLLRGLEDGLWPTAGLIDAVVEGSCREGRHADAHDVMNALEQRGWTPATFHHNCVLMSMSKAGVPDIAVQKLEAMVEEQREGLKESRREGKPDVHSYNWVLEAFAAHPQERYEDTLEFIGRMVEDGTVHPNGKTYSLLVEIFCKDWNFLSEAVRHFRALQRLPGQMTCLDVQRGDRYHATALFLRALCRAGLVQEMQEVLQAMVRDAVRLPASALLVDKRARRTLVSAWMQPCDMEPDYGQPTDYIQRAAEESDNWRVERREKRDIERHGGWWRVKMETDELPGFWLPPPSVSFEESLGRRFRAYRKQLYYTLMWRELAGQGLPTDGNRAVLYARVQRARRLNKALGKPLWTPQTREPVMQASARVEYLLEHLTLDGTAASWPQVIEMMRESERRASAEQQQREKDERQREADEKQRAADERIRAALSGGEEEDDEEDEELDEEEEEEEDEDDDEEEEEDLEVDDVIDDEEDEDEEEEEGAVGEEDEAVDEEEVAPGQAGGMLGGGAEREVAVLAMEEEGVRGKGGLLTSQLVGGAAGGGGGSAAGRAKAKSSVITLGGAEREVSVLAMKEEGVRGGGGLLTSQLVGGAAGGSGGSAAGRAKAKSLDLYDDEDEGEVHAAGRKHPPAEALSSSLSPPLSPLLLPPGPDLYDDEDEGEVHAAAPAILAGSAAQAAEEDEEMQAFRAEEDLIPLSTTLDGIFTLEERWGHWWERADKERAVLPWSERMELDSAWNIFQLVIELGGVPTLADCCMVLWAAVDGNDCRIMQGVVEKSHAIGHKFGINLYKTVVNTCLGLLEIDTAVAILEDMQRAGVQPGDDMWQHVEEARQVAAERVIEEQRRREAAEMAAADVAAGAVSGLQTARGSGTNGYVQANKFAIRHRHTKLEAKEFQEGAGTGGISRKANKEILEHDRKRQIELKLLLLRETLEEQGYLEDEIEEQMEQARAQLEAAMREESEDQALDSLGNQTHQIVARKEKKMETLKAALRINESAKEGDAFDRELQEQRRQERQLAREEAEEARRREEKEREKEERRREKQRRKEEKEMKKRLKKEEKARRRAEEEAAEREEEMRRKEKKARKLREAEEARRAEEAREAEARRAEEEVKRREEEAERREAERLRAERKREEGRRKDEGETRRGDERRGRGREEEQAGERKKQRRDARATDAADIDEGEDRPLAQSALCLSQARALSQPQARSLPQPQARALSQPQALSRPQPQSRPFPQSPALSFPQP